MTLGRRVKRLVLDKVGSLRCGGRHGHTWRLVLLRGRMFLQCDCCGAETEGFVVYRPLRRTA